MKLDKLDGAVFLIVAACLLGVGLAARLGDPARQTPRVAYLYPATAAPQNVWLAEIDAEIARRQLTFSETGVFDFDISRDGRWLAYAERVKSGGLSLRLLDIATGRVRDLVDCAAGRAHCRRHRRATGRSRRRLFRRTVR